jgi:NAD(P)-dependent dehydrogenase (short-subunit alcohol dehydrogenase family)
MTSEYNLNSKVAVITGASKGLGKAMALALGGAGASIALASRDVEQLNQVKKAVEDVGGKAQVFQADVSEEAQIRKLEHDVMGVFNGVQSSEAVGGIHAGRVAPCSRYQPDERLPDVPVVCTAHERYRLRARH